MPFRSRSKAERPSARYGGAPRYEVLTMADKSVEAIVVSEETA